MKILYCSCKNKELPWCVQCSVRNRNRGGCVLLLKPLLCIYKHGSCPTQWLVFIYFFKMSFDIVDDIGWVLVCRNIFQWRMIIYANSTVYHYQNKRAVLMGTYCGNIILCSEWFVSSYSLSSIVNDVNLLWRAGRYVNSILIRTFSVERDVISCHYSREKRGDRSRWW